MANAFGGFSLDAKNSLSRSKTPEADGLQDLRHDRNRHLVRREHVKEATPVVAEEKALTTPAMLDRIARQFPDHVAIADKDRQFTFEGLREEVRQLAAAMIGLGVDRGDRVAIWSPNTWHWVVVCLATHYAGGVVVPINTGFSVAEAGDILVRTSAPLLFAMGEVLGVDRVADLDRAALPALRRIVRIPIDQDDGTWDDFLSGPLASGCRVDARAASVTPEDVADIVFTSGTTGRSKGVVGAHRQALSASVAWAERGGLTSADRYLCVSPFFHNFGYKAGILACLQTGATLVPHRGFDPEQAMALIAEQRITVMPGPPTVYQMMLDHPARRDYNLSSLRLAVTGAATVPVALIERMQTELDFDTVLTAYGLAEASGFGTMCRPTDGPVTVATTCGQPIADFEVRIDSPDPSAAGEVLLRGPNVMLGYLDDPAATAEAIDSEGWLHTGDVGTVDAAGNLRITDRLKDMYICGGFNVYPAEVEQVLAQLGGVAEVAVIGVPDPWLGEVGQAFIVARADTQLDEQAVVTHARRHLPDVKIPRSVVFIAKLPRNAGGKVIKIELRGIARSAQRDAASPSRAKPTPPVGITESDRRVFIAAATHVAPHTPLQQELHRLWALVLNRNDFGITDNFFALGGRSLSAAHLWACLTQELGCTVPMSFIFRLPTVQEQADWIVTLRSEADASLVNLALVGASDTSNSFPPNQSFGERAPLFVIPGYGGTIFDFIALARAMAPARPVLGLRATDRDDPLNDSLAPRDVAALAAHYAEAIIAQRPNGPIHLLGYSAGGWYAHAVAAALLERGAQIGLFAVLDSHALNSLNLTADCRIHLRLYLTLLALQLSRRVRRVMAKVKTEPRPVQFVLDRLRREMVSLCRRVRQLLSRSSGITRSSVETACATPDPRDRDRFITLLRQGYDLPPDAPKQLQLQHHLEFLGPLRRYRPPRLPLTADLFGPPETMALLRRTWRFYARGGVRSRSMFSIHLDFVRPGLMPELATALEQALDRFNINQGNPSRLSAGDDQFGREDSQGATDCDTHQTPAKIDIDIVRLRARYASERTNRLRPEGSTQYIEANGEFAQFADIDPFTPAVARAPIDKEIDVAVIGGGFAGLLCGAMLKKAGVDDVTIIEAGGDFGGVWYWNRYPGVQCDTDAYCYLPLLEELGVLPSQKYADGAEIYQHCQRIGRHFGLYDQAVFSTRVQALRWDHEISRWRITTDRGDDIRARFVVMGSGPFHRPKLPGIPNLEDFGGHSFHSSRWDYTYTGGDPTGGLHKLADKRVALVGTGATGVQLVPFLGRYAKHLYVFQRTPSTVAERHNTPTDPHWVKTLAPGWQKERRRNFHSWTVEALALGQQDQVCDFWTELGRTTAARVLAVDDPLSISPEQFAEIHEFEDYALMERLRRRVDAAVDDPATAESLKPYYRFLCKRPCSNDDYLATFNRPNVTLVDVAASKGVQAATSNGLVAGGVEYPLDCIIYASGFEITTEISRRYTIDTIEGRGGRSLYEHWRDGFKTMHGMTAHGFPNQFFTGFTQVGISTNVTASYEQQGEHIAYIIGEMLKRGARTVEASREAQEQWCRTIRETAVDNSAFEAECTPSYYNNEGGGGGERVRSHQGEPYGPGFYAFGELLADWRARGDLEGLVVTQTV